MIDKKHFFSEGYLLLKNFFNKDDINEILQEARYIFYLQFLAKKYTKLKFNKIKENEFNGLMYKLFAEDITSFSNCGKQAQHLISLHRLSLSNRIIKILKELGLEFPNISTRPVMFFNHPKLAKEKVYYKVMPHQDWRSMQGSLNSMIVWLPLIDINKDLGALEVIPGSHKKGLLTNHVDHGFGVVKTDEMKEGFISVEVERGDALFFSSFLVHQSGENISDQPRWSCHFRYNDLEESTFIQRNFAHPYIYRPHENLITPDFPKSEDIQKIFSVRPAEI